jgi:hypothetical protein
MEKENCENETARLMAIELIVADVLATVCRTTTDPVRALEMKRAKFRWLFGDRRFDIAESVPTNVDPAKIAVAVDQLFAMSAALVSRRDLT